MAVVIPDSLPSRATVGEKRVYGLLRDSLPDSFSAWYEISVQGRYPDFTVLADDFGLLVLEVKGWYAGQIAEVSPETVELHRTEGGQAKVERLQNPIRQVRDYAFRVIDQLSRPEYAILHHSDGTHLGRPCFPYGYGVVFTNITRTQLEAAKLSELFPPDRVITRDELETLQAGADRATIGRLRQLFPAYFAFDPLTKDQIDTIKGILHPEVVVRRRPATPDSVPPGQLLLPGSLALDVLDARQEQVARSMGQGHHVVFGIAGSGKTVLLLARARLFAERSPTARVLVLCYNKALAADLSARLTGAGPGKILIRTIDSWLLYQTRLRREPEEPWEEFQRRMVERLLNGTDRYPKPETYDAILIDEAHDFEPDWFRCVTSRLRGGPEGDLLIALDGAQSLYARNRKFTWKSVGVQAAGRSRRLDRNYRNTKQIIEFAWQVAQSMTNDEETETHVRVLPRKASRQGPWPVYRACASVAEENAWIVQLVEQFRTRQIADREIAVLYPRNERGRADSLHRALRATGEVCWLTTDLGVENMRRALEGPGVRMMTIHAAKGLEFRVVILAALDQLPNTWDPDEARDSKLLYVGLTRANDELVVTWAGRSAFTDRVLASNRVRPLD